MKNILVAFFSLHYEERETQVIEMTRERYARELELKKTRKDHQDWLVKRITPTQANLISYRNVRTRIKSEYSKAIQQKYGVSENWQQNRWFMEQVRPHL